MKCLLFTFLCLAALGIATGCAVGPPASGVSSPERYGGGYWQWQQELGRAYRGTAE